jgi:perosamine synthetase
MIPVFEPIIGEEEINNVVSALRGGELSGTFGHYLESFENEFAQYCGCQYGVAVTSGTTALQLAVMAAGIKQGDEVIVSTSTNIATALGVIHNNAVPVPVDSEEDTWNIDIERVEEKITARTRAIIPVHLFGHPVDMDRLMGLAKRHNLVVIEDCAESHGATCRGKMTGSFGDMGCFSFYANKIITTGEGGMVVTNSKELADRLRLLRNLAFTQPRFRHEVAGHNFRMTGYQAAMGLAQLHRIDHILSEKRRVAHTYNAYLKDIPGVKIPVERDWAKNVYWMYSVEITPEFGMSRDQLAGAMRGAGIDSRTFFCPMNQQPCLQSIPGFRAAPCPVADRIWQSGMYLPSTYTLDDNAIRHIAETIGKFRQPVRVA